MSYRPLGDSSRRYAVAPRVSLLTLLGVCCAGGLVVPSIPDYACSEMTTHDDACSCPGRSRTTCYACAVFLAASGRVVNFFSESGSRCFRGPARPERRELVLVQYLKKVRHRLTSRASNSGLREASTQLNVLAPARAILSRSGLGAAYGPREESLGYFLTT